MYTDASVKRRPLLPRETTVIAKRRQLVFILINAIFIGESFLLSRVVFPFCLKSLSPVNLRAFIGDTLAASFVGFIIDILTARYTIKLTKIPMMAAFDQLQPLG